MFASQKTAWRCACTLCAVAALSAHPLPLGKMSIKEEVDDPGFQYDPKLMSDPRLHSFDALGRQTVVGGGRLGLCRRE